MLNSPEIARLIAYAGEYIRYESVLSDDVRELAIITSARENWCQFEWAAHEPIARRAGVTEETIRDIRNGSLQGNLKGTEAIVVNFTRELMRLNRVSETTFNAGLNEFGEQGLVELTATLGYSDIDDTNFKNVLGDIFMEMLHESVDNDSYRLVNENRNDNTEQLNI